MMRRGVTVIRRAMVLGLLAAACCVGACGKAKSGEDPTGNWHATVKNPSGELVAFTMSVRREGDRFNAEIVNGAERVAASGVSLAGDLLKVRYDFYDGTLEARLRGNELSGTFVRQWEKKTLTREFHAVREGAVTPNSTDGVDLSGDWVFKVGTSDNQRLWRAALQTRGTVAGGTIIPVSGDWGEMSGTWEKGVLTLNHFDGINSRLLRLTEQTDGTLKGEVDLGLFDPKRLVVAERISEKNRELVASMPDPRTNTRMKNPTEPFRFGAPDLTGQNVSWNDERFREKVVVVSITGSWCPNCHEEMPFMEAMYRKYKAEGLEVVALAFEYTGDVARDREQLRLFARKYAVTFPTLLAGTTEEAPAKLDQLVNFGAFPTTIYIGRDGLVKNVHSGFEGRAAGERSMALQAEMESLIRELLAAK